MSSCAFEKHEEKKSTGGILSFENLSINRPFVQNTIENIDVSPFNYETN